MTSPEPAAGVRSWQAAALALVLVAATVQAYRGVVDLDFVEYDDPLYVTKNEQVLKGLRLETAAWALTTEHDYNRIPLTWLSHLVDVELHGTEPAGHHLTSLLFHVANTLLLFAFLLRATGWLGRSAWVAALFALHPLHVESVAWVAERKDVLSTFFAFLALHAYLGFTRAPGLARMAGVTLLYALALAAKSMVMTLPFLLLLLDVWPLGRIDPGFAAAAGRWRDRFARAEIGARLLEKLPLFALTLAAVALTAGAQNRAIVDLEHFPLLQRIASIPIAYLMYLSKTLWPVDLTALYAHPGRAISLGLGAASWLVLGASTIAILRATTRMPWLTVGWLWFLGLLVPVIGIVQAGNQIIADRYTYVAIVGLFIAAAWGVPFLTGGSAPMRRARVALGVASVALCSLATQRQIPIWQSTVTLFEQALRIDETNHVAHAMLGLGLAVEGRDDEAIAHYVRATELSSQNHSLLLRIARRLIDEGEVERPLAVLRRTVELVPTADAARNDLAVLLLRRGDVAEAARELETVVARDPRNARAQLHLARLHLSAGRPALARDGYRLALEVQPASLPARVGLAKALAALGQLEAAIAAAEEAYRIDPGDESIRALLARLRARQDAP